MAKVKVYSIPKQERYQMVGEFFDIVAQLKTKQDIIDFFIGVLTPSESLMIARRIQIAKLLTKGDNYRRVQNELKVSPKTIQSVYHWLNERDEAYKKLMLKYLKTSKKKKQKIIYYESELDKYPQHRLMKKILGL
ncbi:MAG: hypothetical protein DSZ21_00690 [Tenericutes bacterium]|nr:MAG: hypothetical protein DSZ21_00690 [Mycoplasmatota bacterium]